MIPFNPETSSDSALLTYDANGNLSTYTLYVLESSTYVINSQETFSYTGGNLSQTVLVAYFGGIATDTFTTVFQFNTRLSAAPLYIVPGVAIIDVNDLTQTTETETGVNSGSVTTVYSTTYNSANQPVSTTATVTTAPVSSGTIAKETITYTYQ